MVYRLYFVKLYLMKKRVKNRRRIGTGTDFCSADPR